MKQNVFVLAALAVSMNAYGIEKADTTEVDYPPIQEEWQQEQNEESPVDTTSTGGEVFMKETELEMELGASYRLSVLSNLENVYWGPSYYDENQKIFADQDGVVTALQVGEQYAWASAGGNIERCRISILPSDFYVIKKSIAIYPTEKDPTLSAGLTVDLKDSKIILKGSYYGNCSSPSEVKYAIYKNSIFITIDVNYEDTAAVQDPFYLQPIDLTIDNCNAQYYNVYVSGPKFVAGQTAQAAKSVIKYSIGYNSEVITSVNPVEVQRNDGKIYDILGRKLKDIPTSGFYIMNGKKYVR